MLCTPNPGRDCDFWNRRGGVAWASPLAHRIDAPRRHGTEFQRGAGVACLRTLVVHGLPISSLSMVELEESS